ncbi:FkbM family methyltransferase [Mycobacterium sp. B14F4]|uniref:FkbM family methyltransferase n=1 Tax=Mycobacterium sp. B14F4 TaxID=3153565 RepID=UPI00325D52B9
MSSILSEGKRYVREIRRYGFFWALNFAIRIHLYPPIMSAYLRPRSPEELVHLGTGYGGWWIPASVLRPGAVAYCAGAGEDISFDIALHERGLRVVTIDPTPRAVAHVTAVAPESDRFTFVQVGLWDEAGEMRFYVPRDPLSDNYSIVNLQRSSEYVTAEVTPLKALLEELGDATIDILKLDIEGSEHRVIKSFLDSGIRPRVVCIEFDQPVRMRLLTESIRRLQRSGYQLARIDVWNYTFISVGDRQAVTDED